MKGHFATMRLYLCEFMELGRYPEQEGLVFSDIQAEDIDFTLCGLDEFIRRFGEWLFSHMILTVSSQSDLIS